MFKTIKTWDSTHLKLVAFNSLVSLSSGIIVKTPTYKLIPITLAFGSITAMIPLSDGLPTWSATFPCALVIILISSRIILNSKIIALYRAVKINIKSLLESCNELKLDHVNNSNGVIFLASRTHRRPKMLHHSNLSVDIHFLKRTQAFRRHQIQIYLWVFSDNKIQVILGCEVAWKEIIVRVLFLGAYSSYFGIKPKSKVLALQWSDKIVKIWRTQRNAWVYLVT